MYDYQDTLALSLHNAIRKHIRKLKQRNLHPWRIELGNEQYTMLCEPTQMFGLPVDWVPLPDYFRVAYTEWVYERIPE